MPEVEGVLGADFLPMLAGGVAVPIVAGLTPLGAMGGIGVGLAGLALAVTTKGNLKQAGQGALLVAGIGLVSSLIGNMTGGDAEEDDLFA